MTYQLMVLLYILLAFVTIFMEITDKFNTDSIIKKIGLMLIFFGCVLGINGNATMFVPIGLLLYWGKVLQKAYSVKYQRRADDKKISR